MSQYDTVGPGRTSNFNFRSHQMAALHGERWLNAAEFKAISGLIPIIATPADREGRGYHCACACAQDVDLFTYMVAAIRMAHL